MSKMTLRYGPEASQEGDLYLPGSPVPAVVCLLHGGFWRMPYGRDQFASVAEDLAAQGYAVWNIGYRRVGERGGGWPGTLDDAASAIDHLAVLSATVAPLALNKIAVAGHSAGGHLALCAGSARAGSTSGRFAPRSVAPIAIAGLAAITDLEKAFRMNCGNGAVQQLLEGTLEQRRDQYALASPILLPPPTAEQFILHGARDTSVPVEFARNYVDAVRSAGGQVEYVELEQCGHMEFLDPKSLAHRTLCAWLRRATA